MTDPLAPHGPTLATLLILGGTHEASQLAARIRTNDPARRVVLSLAGRTKAPVMPAGVEYRVGGFGGVQGLCDYFRTETIERMIDATHPFAARMAAHAAEAARQTSLPFAKLMRPGWQASPGDDWTAVADEDAAAAMLPAGARPFLALGRQHLGAFLARTDLRPVVRMIDPPEEASGFPGDLIIARPGETIGEEVELFRRHRVTHLVCRNAGGLAGAKLGAARQLKLPVLMIARPSPPQDVTLVHDVDGAMRWLAEPV